MIDLKFAKDNIDKYKFDYQGYLVLVDIIRTDEIISTKNNSKIKRQLILLNEKYKKELDIIKRQEKKEGIFIIKADNLTTKLKYVYDRLPAIGFIKLGLADKIGINKKSITL